MKFRYQKTATGCIGAIELPIQGPGKVIAAASGDNTADALARAALVAERIASDPVMAALMPPQAQAAISAAKGLASAAKRGSKHLRSVWGRLHGPGKQRLARVLHDEALREETAGDNEVGIAPAAYLAYKAGRKYGPTALRKLKEARRRRAERRARERQRARDAEAPEETPDEAQPREPEQPDDDSADNGEDGGES